MTRSPGNWQRIYIVIVKAASADERKGGRSLAHKVSVCFSGPDALGIMCHFLSHWNAEGAGVVPRRKWDKRFRFFKKRGLLLTFVLLCCLCSCISSLVRWPGLSIRHGVQRVCYLLCLFLCVCECCVRRAAAGVNTKKCFCRAWGRTRAHMVCTRGFVYLGNVYLHTHRVLVLKYVPHVLVWSLFKCFSFGVTGACCVSVELGYDATTQM